MADQRNQKNNYRLDGRQAEDFLEKMQKLAKSYTPEWNYDPNDPDIAAVIAKLYADMLEENVDRINQTIPRYHTEFINLLDITARPAIPAKSVVVMELSADTIQGAEVPAGSKLWADSEAQENTDYEEDVIFETIDPLYVTNAKIRDMFMTDLEKGQIFPILGDYRVPDLLYPSQTEPMESLSEEEFGEADELGEIPSAKKLSLTEESTEPEEELQEGNRLQPFTLYGENTGIQQNVCLMYHSHIFDSVENDIYIRLKGAEKIHQQILDGKMIFKYPRNNQLLPVEEVELLEDGETWKLRKKGKGDLQMVSGRDFGLIALESKEAVVEDFVAEEINISTIGDLRPASFVGNEQQEFNVSDFAPFTETLSLYQEVYIGMDEYFSQVGADIHLHFQMLFGEHVERLTAEEEESQLKVIKRKSRTAFTLPTAYVKADQISVEYFNGVGWKKIPAKKDISKLFSLAEPCEMDIHFPCPDNWQRSTAGPYTGRMLRIQLIQADNCYFRPAIHYFPRIKDLQIQFSYQEKGITPELLSVAAGSRKINMTPTMKEGKAISLFTTTGYTEDALYIGLSHRPARGPVGLFIHLKDRTRFERMPVLYHYSTRNGFKSLRVVDRTDYLSHSGLVYFIPPADFCPVSIEGKKDCWIRIIRKESQLEHERNVLPIIEDIKINGVRVQNVDTSEEMDFFISDLTPGASFALNMTNILDADVWVNESGRYSEEQMRKLLIEDRKKYRAEYSIHGEILSFYVKWEETERLGADAPWKSYVLDRLESNLIFGDGINNDIPRVVDDVSIKVTCRRSLGKLGNVDSGAINSSLWNFDYVTSIYNPICASGGSPMENVERALQRGSNILSNRRRLVSEKDFIQEITSFSDDIAQVKMVKGLNPNNEPIMGALSFVILMRNYQQGSYFFHQLSEPLREHLLQSAEMTLEGDSIFITEPVFVDISVTAWVRGMKMEESFSVLHEMEDILEDYFSPIPSGRDAGWEIGSLPTEAQIQLRLGPLKNSVIIHSLTIIASWDDENGHHEKELSETKVTPFMIPRNGTHRIEER